MKQFEYDVIGMGNALIDIEVSVEKKIIEEMDIEIGSMTIINQEKKESLLASVEHKKLSVSKKYVSGGSVANSLYHLSRAGLRCAFIGNVCDDEQGQAYLDDLKKNKIAFLGHVFKSEEIKESTGTCIVFLDERSERTMFTYLGCAPFFKHHNFTHSLPSCNLFYLGGYTIEKGEKWLFIQDVCKKMKENGSFLAFTTGDANCINAYPQEFKKVLDECQICFANADESRSLAGYQRKSDVPLETLLPHFYDENRIFVMTDGENGSFITTSQHLHVPAHPAKIVDLNGAGDAYAAGFISGLFQEKKVLKKNEKGQPHWPGKSKIIAIANEASKLASHVIAHHGPR